MNTLHTTVLITGASSGIGRASAVHFAQSGYRVFAASRTPDTLRDLDPNIHPVFIDLTDPESIREAMASIDDVDILINNAGYGLVSTIEEMEEAQMQAQFDVNVFGVLRMTQAVIPQMRRRRRGVIVNISSFLGKVGLPLLTLYNASKYAVEGITDSLRHELQPFGIRVHTVMPGFFDTQFARGNLVVNDQIAATDSPYAPTVAALIPQIVEQINHGNSAEEIAQLLVDLVEDPHAPIRQSAGDQARKLIPMRQELSDEDFEQRVREYYGLA